MPCISLKGDMMKEVLVLCTNGVEEVEMLATVDMLTRAHVKVTIATINDKNTIVSKHGICLSNLVFAKDINNFDQYDMLFLPGGPHYKEIEDSLLVRKIINTFLDNDKYIAAICAAPTILGRMGILEGKNYTCFTSMNEDFDGHYTDEGVTVDGKLITGKSVYYSIEFGLKFAEVLVSKEEFEALKKQIYYR